MLETNSRSCTSTPFPSDSTLIIFELLETGPSRLGKCKDGHVNPHWSNLELSARKTEQRDVGLLENYGFTILIMFCLFSFSMNPLGRTNWTFAYHSEAFFSQTRSPVNPVSESSVNSIVMDYLVVILMENKNLTSIIGSAAAPYINELADDYGLATNYYDVSNSLSLPNYLGLTTGQSYVSWSSCNKPPSQCPGFTPISAPTIVNSLESSGMTWRAYMEDMPSNCYQNDYNLYVVRHNPFAYFSDIANNPTECDLVVPAGINASRLISDLASPTSASNFMWLTPNLCDDMHNCSVSTGDKYVSLIIPEILNSTVFRAGRASLFLTWDEGGAINATHVPAIWAGPLVRNNFTSAIPHNHYSFLKTLESVWNLSSLTPNDEAASAMTEFLRPPTVSFVYAPKHPMNGQTVSFSASLQGGTTPYALGWSFGDGGRSTQKQTSHAYSTPGSYTVSLSVADALNNTASSTTTLEVSQIIPNPAPRAGVPAAPGSWLLEIEPSSVIAISAVITILCGLLLTREREQKAREEDRKRD